MKNAAKIKMEKGGKIIGTFFWSGSDTIAECLGYSGLDYIIIDSEHSPIDTESTVNLIRIAKSKNLTPFVRVKDSSRSSILKMLDAGAEALVIPNLNSVEDVKKVVEYGKYPPIGQRGFAICRNGGYGYENYAGNLNIYFKTCNKETLLLPMCETAEFLENIETIVLIDGVDGVFVGPYDLSIALGTPGKFETPEFKEALKRIVEVCQSSGKYPMIYSSNPSVANNHMRMGFQSSAIGTDVQMLIQKYRETIEQTKQ
jgi:4-hydroxy-2-oxoheptanedioate aldolase